MREEDRSPELSRTQAFHLHRTMRTLPGIHGDPICAPTLSANTDHYGSRKVLFPARLFPPHCRFRSMVSHGESRDYFRSGVSHIRPSWVKHETPDCPITNAREPPCLKLWNARIRRCGWPSPGCRMTRLHSHSNTEAWPALGRQFVQRSCDTRAQPPSRKSKRP